MNISFKTKSLLFCLNIFLSSFLYSQNTDLFSIKDNTPLTQVLSKISQKENVLFAYPTSIIKNIYLDESEINFNSIPDLIDQLVLLTNLELFALNDSQFLLKEKQEVISKIKSITGKIVDGETGNGLPWATIYSSDYSIGVLSEDDGSFALNCDAEDNDEFIISFLGYEDLKLSYKELESAKIHSLSQDSEVIVDITIAYVVPPTMITEDGQSIKLGEKILKMDTPGLMSSDVIRNVQLLAGVTAHEDDMASLKIRGSNAEGSKIIVDGIPLYNANHYYGIFSSVNGDFIHDATLYKNAQPVQYSDASGGLLILSSDNESSSSNNNHIDLSLLTIGASFDNAISDQWRLKIAGRSTYRNVNDSSLINLNNTNPLQFSGDENNVVLYTNEPAFTFYDLNASLKFKNEKMTISLNGFRSDDNLINNYDRNIAIGTEMITRTVYNNTEKWNNTGASILGNFKLKKDWSLNTTAYLSRYDYDAKVNSELTRDQIMERVENSNLIQFNEIAFNAFVQKKNEKQLIKGGVELNRYDIIHKLEIDKNNPTLDYKEGISFMTLYSEYEQRLGSFILKGGLRVPVTTHKDALKFFFSPLSSVTYNLSDNQKIKASYSYSNQIIRELEYENRLGQNYSFYRLSRGKNFPVLKTNKYMLGYTLEQGAFVFDVEFYHKFINGAMQLLSPLTGFDMMNNGPGTGPYQLYTGQRRISGMDLSISYNVKNYTTWLAYTLSKSEDRYSGLFKGKYFLSQNDRRHQLKWINNWRVNKFDFVSNFVYANGRPYIPLEKLDEIGGKDKLDPSKHQGHLPSYMRIDLGANYNFKIGKTNAKVGMSIFNLQNRQNVKFIQYSHKINGQGPGQGGGDDNVVIGTGGDLLDRTLNLNLSLQF